MRDVLDPLSGRPWDELPWLNAFATHLLAMADLPGVVVSKAAFAPQVRPWNIFRRLLALKSRVGFGAKVASDDYNTMTSS